MGIESFGLKVARFLGVLSVFVGTSASANECYQSSISSPSPFMGNDDEIFKLSDGSIWQVKYEYEYLYEYYPTVVICPSRNKLIIKGKSLNVVPVRTGRSGQASAPSNALTVVYRVSGCDYFVADGRAGLYILEWYGGYDPREGDKLVGYERGYGFKNVTYLANGREGRIYVDDYLLSSASAAEKIHEKCS